ncbi:MAG: Txe/YoeB family addiction module toxin [Chloroflexi bacterium]|nr:Txe/YoeB family addiction module toxin [Chloroflexota bacterium]
MKNLEFEPRAFEDLAWWIREERKTAVRIMRLIENIQQTPFDGLGKPEPLKHELSGLWSRRIDTEHRLVYEILEDKIRILACRYHYD